MTDSTSEPTSVKDIVDNIKNKSVSQPGKVGRPKGKANQGTIQRAIAKRRFIQRVMDHTDQIFNAQLDMALGEKFLMVKITERGPKGGVVRQYHEVVTNPQTIVEYLDGELEGGNSIDDEDHFYYISTKPGNNMAAANMLDRAYGKPTEKVEFGEESDSGLDDLTDEQLNDRIAKYLERRSRT